MTIKLRISLLVIALTLISISGTGMLVFDRSRRALEYRITDSLNSQALHAIDKIERNLFERYQNVKSLMNQSIMDDILADDADGRIYDLLVQTKSDYGTFRELFAVNIDATVVASSDAKYIGESTPEEFWQGKSQAGKNVHYSDVVWLDEISKPAIIFKTPVNFGGEDGDAIGALICLYDWDSLRKITEGLIDSGGHDKLYLLMNSNDRIIDAPDSLKIKFLSTPAEAGITFRKNGYVDVKGLGTYLAGTAEGKGYLTYPGLGWRLIALHSRKAALEPVTRLASTVKIIAVAACFLVGLIGFYFSLGISRPLGELAEAMRLVSGGDFSMRLEEKSRGELGLLQSAYNKMVAGLKERDFIRKSFSRYVSEDVVKHVLAHSEEEGMLKGETRKVTVLFSDIRDFTTFSERHSAGEVVSVMNMYFSRMCAAIEAERGVVDKFIGDAIMAVWGAPYAGEEDAKRACRAAMAMLRELDAMNLELPPDKQLKMGIGINTGEVIAGNIGSENRMEYTVIGDVVNIASRVEGLCKTYGKPLIVTQATLDEAGAKGNHLDSVMVKGKKQPVSVYELTDV